MRGQGYVACEGEVGAWVEGSCVRSAVAGRR